MEVVGIDLHQPVQRLAGAADFAFLHVDVEQLLQHREIHRVAVQFVVHAAGEFHKRQGFRITLDGPFDLAQELIVLPRREHLFLYRGQRLDSPLLLPGFDGAPRQFEESLQRFAAAAVGALENLAGLIQLARLHQRHAVGFLQFGVTFAAPEWGEDLRGAFRLSRRQ